MERQESTHASNWTEPRREAQVFRKILVALDASEAARAAFVFASDWARQFDSQLCSFSSPRGATAVGARL